MPDKEFWGYIELLNGEITDDGLAALIDALSTQPHGQVVAFRDALWTKLRSLDHPSNTIRTGGDQVSADASLYYRCEIVAAGERAYNGAVDSPRPGGECDGAVGEGLLSVANDAAPQELPQAEIEIETGRNRDFWPDAPPSSYPWLELPSPGPFSSRIQSRSNRETRDEFVLRLGFTSFMGYAAGADGHVRELMGCLMAASFAKAREELLPFLHAQLAPGEALDDRVIIWQSGAARPMLGTSLTGPSRRSSLSMDQYIDLYLEGTL